MRRVVFVKVHDIPDEISAEYPHVQSGSWIDSASGVTTTVHRFDGEAGNIVLEAVESLR